MAAFLELGSNYEYYAPSSQIGKIRITILLIEAKQNQDIHKEDVQFLFDHASNPKDLWGSNAPHDIYENKPTEFQDHVLIFLKKNL